MITKEMMQDCGVRVGNCVTKDTIHNGGWYDLRGVKIGWGDLSPKNLEELRKNIGADDALLVLSEKDSYWNFVKTIKGPAFMGHVTTNGGEKHPGIDYVMDHLRLAVHNNKIWHCDRYETCKVDGLTTLGNDVPAVRTIKENMKKHLKKLIKAAKEG
jgi:hypothetical protein